FALTLTLLPEHYPFWSQDRLDRVARIDVLARSKQQAPPATLDLFDKGDKADGTAKKDSLAKTTALGMLLSGKLTNIAAPPKPAGVLRFFFDDRALADLWIAVTWGSN